VFRKFGCTLLLLAVAFANPAAAEDDFPIVGSYTRDIACNGNGSDRPDLLVRIGREQIESHMGVCRILNRKRADNVFHVHVECRMFGDQPVLGDVTFTVRDSTTLDFEDQDHTSDATLHRCPQ
jgi:hypothetical protein